MRRERGVILLSALVLVVLVSAAGVLLLARSGAMLGSAKASLVAAQAHHAADGGLETARHALAGDPSWRGDRFRVGTSDVIVAAERADVGWRVTTRALPGDVALEVRLEPVEGGLPRVASWRRVR